MQSTPVDSMDQTYVCSYGQSDCVVKIISPVPFQSRVVAMLSPGITISSHWLCDRKSLQKAGGLLATALEGAGDDLPIITLNQSDWLDDSVLEQYYGNDSLGAQINGVTVANLFLAVYHGVQGARIPLARALGVTLLAQRLQADPGPLDAVLSIEFKEGTVDARAFLMDPVFASFIDVISDMGCKKTVAAAAKLVAAQLLADMNTPLTLSMALLEPYTSGQKKFINSVCKLMFSPKKRRAMKTRSD